MHVLGNSRHFWHESHSAQFCWTSTSIAVSFSFFFLLFSAVATLSFCAQPSVLPKSCRFFTTVFSTSPPTLGANSCAKTILRTHDIDKSVRVLPNWATSLRQYYDLCHTPADQFSRAFKTARQRRDRARRRFPKFQMFESRWPPAPRLPRGSEASH